MARQAARAVLQRPFLAHALAFLALLGTIEHGCTPEPEQIRLVPNEPPETVISGAPADSANEFHRYHMFWYGLDSDGTIDRYFVAVTDSNVAPRFSDFAPTTSTDSIFSFTANNAVVLSHKLWVYAVDNEGARDPSPANVFFNAVDLHRPEPRIERVEAVVDGVGEMQLAQNDTLPSSGTQVTIHWAGQDLDPGGEITGWRIKLSSDAGFVEVPVDSTQISFIDLPSGDYEFLVVAIDNAGAESRDPAIFRWFVNREPDTFIVRAFVWNVVDGFFELPDLTSNPFIRDRSRVTLCVTGNDADGEITGFSVRRIRRDIERGSENRRPFNDPPFLVATPSLCVSTPVATDTTSVSALYVSNDYRIEVRSHDAEGKKDGIPAALAFRVNFPPEHDPAAVFPADGAVLTQPANPDSQLVVRFAATDLESSIFDLRFLAILDTDFGSIQTGVAAPEQPFPFPEPGLHTLEYRVSDKGDANPDARSRSDTLRVSFTVVAR